MPKVTALRRPLPESRAGPQLKKIVFETVLVSDRKARDLRPILGATLLWVGGVIFALAVLVIILPFLREFAYRYLFLEIPESSTVMMLAITLMVLGYFISKDLFRRADRETRTEVQSALEVGSGVSVSNSQLENLHV